MILLPVIKPIRYSETIEEKRQWLRDKKIEPDQFVRLAFEEKFNKEYGKIFRSKIKVMF